MVLLHGDDDGKVSIGASLFEVVGIYAHYDSHNFFLQVVDAFLCDVADDTGDFIFLSVDFFLERYGRVGGIRHCDVLVPFLMDFFCRII